MIQYLLAFLASFVFIWTKSFQQLNVVHAKYLWILPTSMFMALTEVYVISTVAHVGWGWLVFWIGLGGGLGSCSAVWLHNKVV